MFWESVVAGLKVLAYWEIYVAGLEYMAIFFIPMVIVGTLVRESGSTSQLVGCLSMFFIPLIQAAALAIMMITVSPIVFGLAEDAAWSLPWKIMVVAPEEFFRLVGVLVIAAVVLSCVPVLGQLHSLQTLILGGITLVFVLGIMGSVNPGIIKGRVDWIPGFWFSVGLIVIGGIMSWVGMMVASIVVTVIAIAEKAVGQLIILPIAAVFGFIPVFMYGAWLGLQVRGGF